MNEITAFQPLERVTIPDIGELRCSGLVVVVGPNSSGKSQLLKDLYLRISGDIRTLVVASEIRVRKPEFATFIQWLQSEGYFESIVDDNGTQQWKPLRTYVGSGHAVNQIQPNQAQTWHNSYVPDPSVPRRSEFLNYFGRWLVTALFLERRLTSLNQVGIIDFQTQSPQHDLHALYLDDGARTNLFSELLESFGKAVWPDASRGNSLCLRVSDEGLLPSAEERLSPRKMAAYRSIEAEGDGLKSYVATCVALLLGRRPVCLIDEPEMCLHPPQAHNLGRFIGKHGGSSANVTFVATHSSQILRGVIQTAKDIQVVRLTRHENRFSGHLVPAAVLAEAVARPTVRAESVLDGIFAQSVVIVEADSDRLVYQAVWERLASELRLDVHFAAVGGSGGIAETCRLYRTLRIPVAVIADLDVISDSTKLERVLYAMTTSDEALALATLAGSVTDLIKQLPPTVEPLQVQRRLGQLSAQIRNWNANVDVTLRSDLTHVCHQLDRMRRLKRGGTRAFSADIADRLTTLLERLKHVGMFLAPVGELEEWLSHAGIEESKENKWAWANAAALFIQSNDAGAGDIWGFVREVGAYVRQT